MANALLTPTIIAKEALRVLENELVVGDLVYRDFESNFGETKIGTTLTIRKPVRWTTRTGATAAIQDADEGSTTVVVDTQVGVDMSFRSDDLTLTIERFSERYVRPAMIQIANKVDVDLLALYKKVWNYVGANPPVTLNTLAKFFKGPERLDNISVPLGMRYACLTPADYYAMQAVLTTSIFSTGITEGAIKKARSIPNLAGVDVYQAQNIRTHRVGTYTGTPLTNGAAQQVTYASSKTTNTQTLITDGWTSTSLKAGDVFTIADVFEVNPVTKDALTTLKQFTVVNDISDTAGAITLTMAPAAVLTGAYQNVSAAIGDNKTIVVWGTSATDYSQNLMFHRDAFALVTVPMEMPVGGVRGGRQSYKGLNVRYLEQYDITNDRNIYRFDVLYGVKAVYPDLAIRIAG